MKKLNKLLINSEKIMKNEELVTLKGGYDGCNFWCDIFYGSEYLGGGRACGSSVEQITQDCNAQYNPIGECCVCWAL